MLKVILLLVVFTVVVNADSPPLPNKLCKKSGFFRNPYDCTLYYRCVPKGKGRFDLVDYRAYPCKDGLIFDEKEEVCAHPEDTEKCVEKPYPPRSGIFRRKFNKSLLAISNDLFLNSKEF